MVDKEAGIIKETDTYNVGEVYEIKGEKYLYFPLWTSNGEEEIFRGKWWPTKQVEWSGPDGDKERLKEKHGDELKYGEMAWKEAEEMLIKVYGKSDELIEMLNGVEKVHEEVYKIASNLPENKRPAYHNIGSWKEADGHGVQVALGMVRDLCGREKGLSLESMKLILEGLELEKELLSDYREDNNKLSLKQMEIVIKSAFAHDEDWLDIVMPENLKKNYEDGSDWEKKRIRLGLIYEKEEPEDLDRITDLVCLMSYGEENKESVKKGFLNLVKKWGVGQAGLYYSTFRKMDLAQVLDGVYLNDGEVGLGFDFTAIHPDYFVPWPDISKLEGDLRIVKIEPSARFLRFALKKMTEEGFLEFYGPDKDLLKEALKNLEEYVEKIDSDYFNRQYSSMWEKRKDGRWVRVKKVEDTCKPSIVESP
ncbi:MAG: hypothetical protein U9Q63_01500 [Patescibacteria group bacterium]|nr:hypothetical protein [Patescibacteria group bacterium]